MSEGSSEKIFSSVKYFLSGTLPENVRSLLDDGGAQKVNFFSSSVTHCIVGDNPKETDLSDAKDLYEVPAVTYYWVLLSQQCQKPLPTKGFLYDLKQVFYGTKMTVSQVSQADYKALWAMVTFYGGMFNSKLTPDCTHLIASRAGGAKFEAALKAPSIKIVTPDWIVECINKNRKIPEDNYHPKYLVIPKPKESPLPGDLSTAQILGFADETATAPITEGILSSQTPAASTQALLEKLKQRMPWNQSSPSSTTAPLTPTTPGGMPTGPMQLQTSQFSQPQQQMAQPIQTQAQQQQQQQNQPMMQRMVTPQMMMMRPQQAQQMQQQQMQQSPGPQMKQFRLVQRDPNAIHQQRMEMVPGQVPLQQQQGQPQQIGQQQQIIGQLGQQQQLIGQQGQVDGQPQTILSLQQQSILQGPGVQLQQGIQMAGGARQVTWAQGTQLQGPPKQVIQLDPQTHAQLAQMDPQQKMIFLQRIHQRQMAMQQQQRQLQMQQQAQQQQQQVQVQQKQVSQQQVIQQRQPGPGQVQVQGGQQVAIGGMQMRQPQIIIRGMSPQQQTAWLQQQQQQQFIRQQMVVQQGVPMRQGVPQRVIQQQTATATWIPQQDGTGAPPTQQQLHQLQLQRQQQQQQLRMHQMKHQVVIQRAAGPGGPIHQYAQVQQVQQVTQLAQQTQPGTAPQQQGQQSLPAEEVASADSSGAGGGVVVNSVNRTKTALANMLSSRLHTGHLSPHSLSQDVCEFQQQVMGVGVAADGSAAGQLRLMSAQQRAPQPPPPPQLTEPQSPVTPGPGVMYSQQQQQQLQQPRRTLGNISNPQGVVTQGPKSPARAPMVSPGPTPPIPAPPKPPQFFTHNPNLRIPLDKYLIGCVFYIVEYDKSTSPDVDITAWEEIICEHGGEVETNYTHRVTHVLCETQKHGIVQQAIRDAKRCVTAYWLNDVVLKGSLSVPWLALHFPVPFGKEKPLSKYHMTLTGFDDRTERDRVTMMIRVAGGQYRNYFSPVTHIVVCKKPEGAKYRKAKELGKATVNVQWLNEVLLGHFSCIQQPEQQKYQQYNPTTSVFRVEYSLIPHLMGAWKCPISMTPDAYNAVKNAPSPPPRKKPRLTAPTMEQVREMESKVLDAVPVINIQLLTMETRPWVAITGDQNLEFSKKAKQLGCFLVKSLSKVTHLVVCGKPVRTVKLLTCLITCKYVLQESWLTDSAAQNRLLPEGPYQISNIDLEDFKCNVTQLLANPDRTSLLKDKMFYLTPGVFPSRTALSEMVELSGGRVEKQRRSVKAIRELNSITPTYFVVACYNDLPIIADVFRAKLEFYSTELIMSAIATQTFSPSASVYKY